MHPALALAAAAVGVTAMMAAAVMASPYGLRTALVTAETALALPSLLLLAVAGRNVPRSLGLRPLARRATLLALVCGASLWAASLGLMNLQFVVWAPPPEFLETFRLLHQQLRPHSVGEGLLSVLAIGLMPALCEETVFRGIVLPSLLRWGTAVGLLGSSLLFALIHIDSAGNALVFHRLPFAFAVGLGLAALRLAAGSLLASMLAHAVLNTITFATVFLSGAASQAVDEPSAGSGALLLAVGAVITFWLFRALRR
jgi:membrane protease YdiL (CAAX protease family)